MPDHFFRTAVVALIAALPAAASAAPLSGWSFTGTAGVSSRYQDSGSAPRSSAHWLAGLEAGRAVNGVVSLRARVDRHLFAYQNPDDRVFVEIPGPTVVSGRRRVSFLGAGVGLRLARPGAVSPFTEVMPMLYRARVADERLSGVDPAPLVRPVAGFETAFGVDTRLATHLRAELALGWSVSRALPGRGPEWQPFNGLDQMTGALGFTWAP